MTRIVLLLVLAVLGWQAYSRYTQSKLAQAVEAPTEAVSRQVPLTSSTAPAPQSAIQFRCDGRKRCSQMTSCAEATYFLRNCPGVEMDGDHDGIPCEQQWC